MTPPFGIIEVTKRQLAIELRIKTRRQLSHCKPCRIHFTYAANNDSLMQRVTVDHQTSKMVHEIDNDVDESGLSHIYYDYGPLFARMLAFDHLG